MLQKSTLFFVAALSLASFTLVAQNQITTPSGQPLIIGANGLRHGGLTSASPTQSSNGKVLSLDGTGTFMLVPAGVSSQWTTAGSSINYNLGNVGLGVASPLQRLDVNGNINISTGSGIRINNITQFRQIGTLTSVAIGEGAGNTASTTAAADNILIGYFAGSKSEAPFNILIGTRAGLNVTTGSNNTFIGRDAGRTTTTGTRNFFMGTSSGFTNNGSDNVFIGFFSGFSNTSGFNNFFAGTNSGYNNTTGENNLMFGRDAGFNNTTGSRNTYLGFGAGTGIVGGNNNTFIGFSARPTGAGAASLTNSVAIGANAQVSASNSIILGGTGAAQASVGIGITAPTARLHVVAGGTIATGVRFQSLPTASGTVFRLYVDADGNMMRASTSGLRESAEAGEDRNWALTPDNHLVNTNTGGIIIGTGVDRTPSGYSLYVSKGILTERVKVAVRSTDEWRDNVFQPTYRLRTIEEVASYIEQHKHLPGVPSAEEMVANGNDLQKTDGILLEKIEEMMLYIIELKKENAELKKVVEEIKQKKP